MRLDLNLWPDKLVLGDPHYRCGIFYKIPAFAGMTVIQSVMKI